VDVRADLGDACEQVPGPDDVRREGEIDRRVEGDVACTVHDGRDVHREGWYVGQVALEDLQPGSDELLHAPGGLDRLGEDGFLEHRLDPVHAAG
jgi:hypothetical protein